MKKSNINIAKEVYKDEQKERCFQNIELLGDLLRDNYHIFQDMIDSESIKYNTEQYDTLVAVMSERDFLDFTNFLYYICAEANQVRFHGFGGYAYILYHDEIYFINDMNGQGHLSQFGFVPNIPAEDKDMKPFDIVSYGLDSLKVLFENNIQKCLHNACIKYNVNVVENINFDVQDVYYVTDRQVTYNFTPYFDRNFLKRLALVYFCWAKREIKRPIMSDLSLRIRAWDKALKQMAEDGFPILAKTKERIYLKHEQLKNFINYDLHVFFKRIEGLFDVIPEEKVIVYHNNNNAHCYKEGTVDEKYDVPLPLEERR